MSFLLAELVQFSQVILHLLSLDEFFFLLLVLLMD